MSSIFGNIPDTNVYSKKRFLNPANEYFGTIVNPTVIDGQQAISAEELGYLSGATGNIQDQLDNKIEAGDMVTFTSEIDFNGPVFFNDLDTPPHCEAVPINANDLCNKAYVDAQAPLTAFQLFCNQSETFTPAYKTLSTTETFVPTTIAFTVNNTADVLISSFINTLSNLQLPNSIPPGNWTLNTYSNVNSINDQAHVGIYFVVFAKNGGGGPDVVLATSSVSPLISVVTPAKGTYSNVITFPSTDLTGYDRIGIKIYVQSNVNSNHSGTMFFQDGTSYTSLLTSFATTQAANILGNNNTWTGTNAFNSTTSFGATATFGSTLSISSSVPTISSSSTTNDLTLVPGAGRQIRLSGQISLGGSANDAILNQQNVVSPFNRLISNNQAASNGSYNGLTQIGDNILIFGNNATQGVPPTAVIGLWGVNAGRVGLRMSTTDYNIEGGTGNMTLRMNNTTAMTINSSAEATFANTVNASITGNAGTVTNGVYTNQTYNNPPWLGTVDGSKIVGDILTGSIKSPIGGIFGFSIDNDSTNTGDISIYQKNGTRDVKITTTGTNNKITLQPNETEAFYVSAGQVVSRRAFSTIYNTRLNNPVAKFVSSDNAANNAGVQIAADVAADGLYNGLSLTGDHIVFGGNNSVGKIVVGPYTSNRTGIRMTATVTTIEGSTSVSIRANNITTAEFGSFKTTLYRPIKVSCNSSSFTNLLHLEDNTGTNKLILGIVNAQQDANLYNGLAVQGDNILIGGDINDNGNLVVGATGANRNGAKFESTGTSTFSAETNVKLDVAGSNKVSITSSSVDSTVNITTPNPPMTGIGRIDRSSNVATTDWIFNNLPDHMRLWYPKLVASTANLDTITASNTYSNSAFQALCTAVYLNAGTVFRGYAYYSSSSNATPFRMALFGPDYTGSYVANTDTGSWSGAGGVGARIAYNLPSTVTIATSGVYYIYMHPNLSIAAGRVYCTSSISNGLTNWDGATSFESVVKNNTGRLRSFQISVSGATQNPTLIDFPNATVVSITAQTTGIVLYQA